VNPLEAVLHSAVNPALKLLPAKMDSDDSRVMILTAGLQESKFEWRYQRTKNPYVKGPARGFWQNERGGVFCVMTNRATRAHAEVVCKARGVPFDQVLIHERLEHDDVLAAAFARLLLWADPKPLPPVDADHETAWECYLRCWRPGKPHRETWDAYHAQARAQVLTQKESP
jgi:hypothetical protein